MASSRVAEKKIEDRTEQQSERAPGPPRHRRDGRRRASTRGVSTRDVSVYAASARRVFPRGVSTRGVSTRGVPARGVPAHGVTARVTTRCASRCTSEPREAGRTRSPSIDQTALLRDFPVPVQRIDGRSLLAPGSTLPSAFQPHAVVALGEVHSPVTVAGPRRIRTDFLRFAVDKHHEENTPGTEPSRMARS